VADSASYESVYVRGAIDGQVPLIPTRLVKEIEKTDYMGVIGKVKFDKNHQVIYGDDPNKTRVPRLSVAEWEDGLPLYPPQLPKERLSCPPWMKK